MAENPISTALLPEGFRDRLPPEAEAAATLMRSLLDHFASHGYDRVQPPLVEYEAGLIGRLGVTLRQELLRFIDPVSRHTLALRPDMTGQAGRIAATRMAHVPRPLRLAYGGPVLRVKGTQLDPEREMIQVGAELIGRDSVAAVVEVLTLAVAALTRAGVAGLTVDLTLPSFVADVTAIWGESPSPLATAASIDLASLEALLDGKDVAGLRAAGAARYEPLIAAAGPAKPALAALGELDVGPALAARLADTAAVVAALEGLPPRTSSGKNVPGGGGFEEIAHSINVTLDPTERHGFDYQRWIGFTLFADGIPGEIGRGGAYTISHGDHGEPAVGFSLYIDRLVDAGLGVTTRRRIALPLGTLAAVGETLRANGWTTIAALDDRAVAGCTHVWNGVEATVLPSPSGKGQETERSDGPGVGQSPDSQVPPHPRPVP